MGPYLSYTTYTLQSSARKSSSQEIMNSNSAFPDMKLVFLGNLAADLLRITPETAKIFCPGQHMEHRNPYPAAPQPRHASSPSGVGALEYPPTTYSLRVYQLGRKHIHHLPSSCEGPWTRRK